MENTAVTQLPSLAWARHQAEVAANQNPGHAQPPTWPAHFEPPHSESLGQPQPNLLLQLTQILEWETWNHDQTRSSLSTEKARCGMLEGTVWKLEYDVAHWQQSCNTVYAALNEHRAENAGLKRDMDGLLIEVQHLRQVSTLA
jgi:hypothetical protein